MEWFDDVDIEQVWPPLCEGPEVWASNALWPPLFHCVRCFERALAAEV